MGPIVLGVEEAIRYNKYFKDTTIFFHCIGHVQQFPFRDFLIERFSNLLCNFFQLKGIFEEHYVLVIFNVGGLQK